MMRVTIRQVRYIIREELKEALVSASPEYMRKEAVRERLQSLVHEMIDSNEIRSDEDLNEFWRSVEMSVRALRMVPFGALKR
jgi:hypothetical protein